MTRHLLSACATALLLLTVLGACGSVTALDDTGCPKAETTTTTVLPIDTGAIDAWITSRCIEDAPTIDATGRVDCFVLTARAAKNGFTCDPDRGLIPVSAAHQEALDRLRETDDAKSHGWNTFCEIVQLDPGGVAAETCRTEEFGEALDESGNPAHGFCYIDATTVPPIGNPELVDWWCPEHPLRALHFVDVDAVAAAPESQSVTVVCSHEVCSAP